MKYFIEEKKNKFILSVQIALFYDRSRIDPRTMYLHYAHCTIHPFRRNKRNFNRNEWLFVVEKKNVKEKRTQSQHLRNSFRNLFSYFFNFFLFHKQSPKHAQKNMKWTHANKRMLQKKGVLNCSINPSAFFCSKKILSIIIIIKIFHWLLLLFWKKCKNRYLFVREDLSVQQFEFWITGYGSIDFKRYTGKANAQFHQLYVGGFRIGQCWAKYFKKTFHIQKKIKKVLRIQNTFINEF